MEAYAQRVNVQASCNGLHSSQNLLAIGFVLLSLPSHTVAADAFQFSRGEICKAGISVVTGRNAAEMLIHNVRSEQLLVSYVTKDDGKRWTYKCRLDGQRILWGADDGRWRTDPRDGTVTFKFVDAQLSVQETFSDGSANARSFSKHQLAIAQEKRSPQRKDERKSNNSACEGYENPLECFVGKTEWGYWFCTLAASTAKATMLQDTVTAYKSPDGAVEKISNAYGHMLDEVIQCAKESKEKVQPVYRLALTHLAKRTDSQAMLKDYYAFWMNALDDIRPKLDESEVIYKVRQDINSSLLKQRARRLELEK